MLLAAMSFVVATIMHRLRVPAAFMLGPMLVAICVGLSGAGIRLRKEFSLGAQAIMGCLIANLINPALLAALGSHWLALLAVNIAAMLLIFALGLFIARREWLPDTTAIWGLSPGAAPAMVLLADSHGADARLVAMMQYSRVPLVSMTAIAVAAALPHAYSSTAPAVPGILADTWFPPIHLQAALSALSLALLGYLSSRYTGVSSLALFIPAFGGALLTGFGAITLQVPVVASTLAFAVTGWHVGLSFTRKSALHCLRLFPRMLLAIATLILICGLLSLLLARWIPGIDALTAYLALSPGGIETSVLIASGTSVSLSLVLASQFVRLILVMSAGPLIAKLAAKMVAQHR